MESDSNSLQIHLPVGFCADILKNMGIHATPKDIKQPTVYK